MRVSRRFFLLRLDLYPLLVQPLPEINLDPFEVCLFKLWEVGGLMYYNLSMFFGTSSPE
jgi:hypothetical protein